MCDNFIHAVSVTHMQSILPLFWRIATFKAGPESIPFSPFLATGLIAINILTASTLIMFLSDIRLIQALSSAIVSLATTAALTWVLLWLMRHRERFMQTLIAMVGADLIISLVQGVALAFTQVMSQMLAAVVLLGTAFWGIAIYGFIFHRALNIHIGLGFAVAFILSLITTSITSTMLPQA